MWTPCSSCDMPAGVEGLDRDLSGGEPCLLGSPGLLQPQRSGAPTSGDTGLAASWGRRGHSYLCVLLILGFLSDWKQGSHPAA